MILAIDPGNIESGIVLIDDNLKPIEFGKYVNENVRQELRRYIKKYGYDLCIVIEMIDSYGMAVGKEVFETCVWIGRYKEMAEYYNMNATYIYRKEEKLNLCHSNRANDSNIRRALIDRFAKHDLKNGKGTKKNPDWFYGFAKDVWAAYAVGITYYDMYVKGEQ
ncbi:MAG: hypothetical protein Q8936_01805 [Bacillota bacterium]|nr:hypothetical protein [Bacillota bacterium]